MKKHYISADQLLQDSVELALRIVEDTWHPDVLVAIWRGGTPVGVAMHEVLDFVGIRTDHIAIRTSSYTGIGTRARLTVEGLDAVVRRIRGGERLLLVDDVFDTGLSLARVVDELRSLCGDGQPDIRLATPYFKPANNVTPHEPDYYLYTTSDWLVFPHELQGLTDEEILRHKPGLQAQTARLLEVRDKLLVQALGELP